MRLQFSVGILGSVANLLLAFPLSGQVASPACGAAPVVPANAQPNIFSEQQEEWLGDATADLVEREYRLVDDPAQSAYLQSIADKLATTIPGTHIHFRVQVIDSSEVNGFSLAGGRIYITRKLAASAQNDDELASVIGHEIGHVASHQFAFEATENFRRFLNVTSVGDRADIRAKFQQLVDAEMRGKKAPAGGDTDDKQDEADRIGVYVIAAAGYRPQSNADFWDRMFFTQGKTGGRFSDFFGISKPNERRLGRIRRLVAALPPGCGGSAPVLSANFTAWRRLVTENRKTTQAHLEGAREVKLTPPLHMDLDRIVFSPDGKMLLAQDESSIYALTREPLAVQFRVDAEGALPAQFSPDSQHLVFGTQGLHTETWSLSEKKLLEAHEPRTPHHCLQAKLSPDGRTVSCLQQNLDSHTLDLSLLDADSGQVLWSKNRFFEPSLFFSFLMMFTSGEEWVGDYVPSSFSPDGNFLLIGPGDAKLAFDLRTRTPAKVNGDLKNKVTGHFAFVANDQVAGVNITNPRDSGVFSFPDGKRLKKYTMPFDRMRSVSGNDGTMYVVANGEKDFRWELADLESGHFLLGTHTDALDIWNGRVAIEGTDGSVALAKLDGGKIVDPQRVALPMSPLASLHASALSKDGRYLALSTREHGGVWDVASGKELFRLQGFTQAAWDTGGKLYAEFPKDGGSARRVHEITIAPQFAKLMSYTVDDKNHLRYGMLIDLQDKGKAGTNFVMRNSADNSVLWEKTFADEMPGFTASAGGMDLLFAYPMQGKEARSRLKANGTLASEAMGIKQKENGRLLEIVNARTGSTEAEMVLERPPDFAGVDGLNRVGDQLYVTGDQNRTLVYSLRDGKELWKANGNLVASDLGRRRVCLQNRRDEVTVYSETGVELQHLRVGSPLRFVSFTGGGDHLLLMGSDQVLRSVDIKPGGAPQLP